MEMAFRLLGMLFLEYIDIGIVNIISFISSNEEFPQLAGFNKCMLRYDSQVPRFVGLEKQISTPLGFNVTTGPEKEVIGIVDVKDQYPSEGASTRIRSLCHHPSNRSKLSTGEVRGKPTRSGSTAATITSFNGLPLMLEYAIEDRDDILSSSMTPEVRASKDVIENAMKPILLGI